MMPPISLQYSVTSASLSNAFFIFWPFEEALVGGIIENHPDFIDEAPFNPWALVRDTLLSMRMRILCIKYLDMQATGSPSERERAIVCFWRAAPGEAGDVRYVERGEL